MQSGEAVPTVLAARLLIVISFYGVLLTPSWLLAFGAQIPKISSLTAPNNSPHDSQPHHGEKPAILGWDSVPPSERWIPLGVCVHRGDDDEASTLVVNVEEGNHLELQVVHRKKGPVPARTRKHQPGSSSHRRIPRGIQKIPTGSAAGLAELLLELDGVDANTEATKRIRKRHHKPPGSKTKNPKHTNNKIKKKQINGEDEFAVLSSAELGSRDSTALYGSQSSRLDDVLEQKTPGKSHKRSKKKPAAKQGKHGDKTEKKPPDHHEQNKDDISRNQTPSEADYSLPFAKMKGKRRHKEGDTGGSAVQLDEAAGDYDQQDDEEAASTVEDEDEAVHPEVEDAEQDDSKAHDEHVVEEVDDISDSIACKDDPKQLLDSFESAETHPNKRAEKSMKQGKSTKTKNATKATTRPKHSSTAKSTVKRTKKTTVPPLLKTCSLSTAIIETSTLIGEGSGERPHEAISASNNKDETCLPTETAPADQASHEVAAITADDECPLITSTEETVCCATFSQAPTWPTTTDDHAERQTSEVSFKTPYPNYPTTEPWYSPGPFIELSSLDKPMSGEDPAPMLGNAFPRPPEDPLPHEMANTIRPGGHWPTPKTNAMLFTPFDGLTTSTKSPNIIFFTPATRISFTEIDHHHMTRPAFPIIVQQEASTIKPVIVHPALGVHVEEVGEETTTVAGPVAAPLGFEDVPVAIGLQHGDTRPQDWHAIAAVPYVVPYPALLPPRMPMGAYVPHVLAGSPMGPAYEAIVLDPFNQHPPQMIMSSSTPSPDGVKRLPGFRHHKIQGETVELSHPMFASAVTKKAKTGLKWAKGVHVPKRLSPTFMKLMPAAGRPQQLLLPGAKSSRPIIQRPSVQNGLPVEQQKFFSMFPQNPPMEPQGQLKIYQMGA